MSSTTQPLVQHKDEDADVEARGRGVAAPPLYPSMIESPELRWSFIRKVYSIITIQLLFTIAVAITVVSVPPLSHFLADTAAGFALLIALVVVSIIVLLPLYCYAEKHPVNYILLGSFTLCSSILVGLSCAFTSGYVILEALILTTAVVVSMSLYTFWAVKRGHSFNFLALLVFAAIIILILCFFIQIVHPLGTIYDVVYGVVVSILFCTYIIVDTYALIKRYTYDQYVLASLSLYVDILRVFAFLIRIFSRR